jgi:hypothetical protein
MKKENQTFGNAEEGNIISTDKIPYCGQVDIWGETNDKGEIIDWSGDTGGEFERDFTATWTPAGYKITWTKL